MFFCISKVLSGEELSLIRARLEKAKFVDGKLTAGWHARRVKDNLQLDGESDVVARLARAIETHDLIRAAALPRRIRPPMIAVYEPGMSYGSHVDDAIIGRTEPIRSDLSLTLFLDPPDTYDGGALIVENAAGEQEIKLEAGDAVLYPSTSLHRVAPVTRGNRRVAVTWIQSLVRDPAQREILFDLDQARRAAFQRDGKSREFDLLAKTYANLLRMWGEL